MTNVLKFSTGLVLALSLAACDRAAAPAGENTAVAADVSAAADAEAVKAAFAKFNADIAAKDLDAIKAHYATDAVMVISNYGPFEGIDAIMGDYKTYAADPAAKYSPGAETVTVSPSGDMAYGEVKYQSTYTHPQTKAVVTVDRYNISVYQKQPDGSWKIVRDINPDLPKAS